MDDLAEGAGRGRANALGRRVGRDQLREGGLEGDQLAHEAVVFGVGEFGRVLLVVELAGAPDDRDQLVVPAARFFRPERAGSLDGLGRDRQPDRLTRSTRSPLRPPCHVLLAG